MTIFSIFSVDGYEQAVREKEFNTLHDFGRYLEYTAGDLRVLFPYCDMFTNDLIIPEKGVERFFDKTIFCCAHTQGKQLPKTL